jgi:hypothetical protein
MKLGPEDEYVELELRQKSEGQSMADVDQSAHQFSHRDASIQADSEERLDNEMQASMREGRGAG